MLFHAFFVARGRRARISQLAMQSITCCPYVNAHLLLAFAGQLFLWLRGSVKLR